MTKYNAPVIQLLRDTDGFNFEVPRDCRWVEREQSINVVQEIDHTIGGSAVIHNGVKLGGIEFTLTSREGVWFTRAQAEALVREARDNPEGKYTITLPTGETKNLCWRHIPGATFSTVNLSETADMQDAVYTGTLNFWE